MSSYHYSFYSPTECTAWVFSHRFHCLLRIFSHRFHRFTQNFLLSVSSHRLHRFTQKLGCLKGVHLSQVHQPSKIDILPRNPQNPQNCLLNIFSHRLHRLTQKLGCLQGGALVSARLCRLPEQEVNQPNKIDILPRNPQNLQNCLLSVFSHRFHRFTQKLGCLQGGALVSARLCRLPEQEVHQPNKIDILPRNPQNPQNFLLSVFSHRLHRFTQIVWVHPLKLAASVSICEICGRLFSAESSVNSACSVGGTLLLRRQGYLRYYLPHPNHLCQSVKSVGESSHPNHLCRSVKSVGEYPPAEGSVNSAYSVGDP